MIFFCVAVLFLCLFAFCAYMADREIRLLDDEIRGER